MSRDEPRDRDRGAQPTEVGGGGVDWGINLEPGSVLGDRYEIRSLLGAGGMGEVWHAFDLKLRVEVALKALRPELFRDESRRELLRSEVRAAREVMSPNVCRIFDLVEVDGGELVSMEYVDGQTLLEVLEERGPLKLKEAQDIASQFLAGLEAIHRVGLVHRDVKPENIMLTRAGRVVLMDFGLARQEAEGSGSVSGTPAYMSPEQAAGLKVDARADVYSAGVVLAEMVHPDGIKELDSRKSLWEGIRREPARVPETPWKPVLKRAVARDPDARYDSAHRLTRALEDMTLRVEGAEDLTPYPGMAAFTEAEAEYYFGREAEVERLWRRLDRPRLLAIVGPSGSGKTSFIRAGLIPSAATDWAIVRCTPGNTALASLRMALAPEISRDPAAVGELAAADADSTVSAFSRWRARHGQALLVVDQFEELFTLNPAREQERFAELLGRLALEADVFVLLSMRDDFLMRCRDHEALQPIFADLTALPTLAGSALRRALVLPATKCGYRFEEEDLVDEMLAEVEGERGALPLLAFTVARIWEQRDRENGLLTRETYDDVGGVGGALAQHAEAIIDRIGLERIPIVRELFRNLVTAEGTRAVREWDELLSIFGDSRIESQAEEVLLELIDARLLTSYEVRREGETPTRTVEIVHESLLEKWPRLAGWRTQDADSARVRDELRQAARTWDEHGRSDDLLWTGSAFREFAVWRDRYPGGLTEVEQAFATAMTAYGKRRKRRRRLAVTAAFFGLLAVLAIVGISRHQAVAEAKRAEAAKLLALGEVELDSYPTAALAWATASLDLSDTLEGRLLALRALYRGPPVTVDPVPESRTAWRCVFSPSGKWLARKSGGRIHLRSQDGSQPIVVGRETSPEHSAFVTDDVLITEWRGVHQWWSLEDLATPQRTEGKRGFLRAVRGDGYFSYSTTHPDYPSLHVLGDVATGKDDWDWIHWWPLDGGSPRLVGGMETWEWDGDDIDSKGRWLVYPRGNTVYLRSLLDWSRAPLRFGEFGQKVDRASFRPDGQQVAAVDESGEVRIWRRSGGSAEAVRRLKLAGVFGDLAYGPAGRWLALSSTSRTGCGTSAWLVDLMAPLGAAPLELRRSDPGYADAAGHMVFHPSGAWLAVPNFYTVGFWPLSHPYPRVFDHGGPVGNVKFTPDGKWLLSVSEVGEGPGGGGQLRAWPLEGQNAGASRVLLEQPDQGFFLADLEIDPSGEHVAVGSGAHGGRVYIVPIAGGPPRELEPTQGAAAAQLSYELAYSPDGRLLAAVPINTIANPELKVQVWDLVTGGSQVLGPVGKMTSSLRFVDDRHLVWTGLDQSGEVTEEVSLDFGTGAVEVVSEEGLLRDRYEGIRLVSPSGSLVLKVGFVHTETSDDSELYTTDLGTGETRHITTHGDDPFAVALDPTGQVMVTGGVEHGPVRVGPVSGDEPYLLFGHRGGVQAVVVSPDGRWIASGGDDSTLRLWPMPDLSKPPLHTLPHDQLIAKLHTLTNLRAVRDDQSSTGWKVEIGPFPGWERVPEW